MLSVVSCVEIFILCTIVKTANECEWDPIKLMFLYCMHQRFNFFCKYWSDDDLLRPKLVANSSITIKYYIPYFPAYKTHHDFFVRNFRKK